MGELPSWARDAAFHRSAGPGDFQPQNEALQIGSAAYRVRFEAAGFIEETGPSGETQILQSSTRWAARTPTICSPRWSGAGSKSCPSPSTRTAKRGTTWPRAARASTAACHQAPLPWTDSAFTFNTSCYGCHASQLHTNYDPVADAYRTSWKEPGINCEACHGDAAAHLNWLRAPCRPRAKTRILFRSLASLIRSATKCALPVTPR